MSLYIDAIEELQVPLKIATCLDSFYYLEDQGLGDAYHKHLWAAEIMPTVEALFGEEYATTMPRTSRQAALIEYFFKTLFQHLEEMRGEDEAVQQ